MLGLMENLLPKAAKTSFTGEGDSRLTPPESRKVSTGVFLIILAQFYDDTYKFNKDRIFPRTAV